MRLVADTHAIVWHLTAARKVGREAERAFAAADEGRWLCCVPAIVLAEVALLHERGRVRVSPGEILRTLQGRPGYAVLAMDAEQALEFAGMRGIKDSVDRLILAAARTCGARLLSADDGFDGFGVDRVWD